MRSGWASHAPGDMYTSIHSHVHAHTHTHTHTHRMLVSVCGWLGWLRTPADALALDVTPTSGCTHTCRCFTTHVFFVSSYPAISLSLSLSLSLALSLSLSIYIRTRTDWLADTHTHAPRTASFPCTLVQPCWASTWADIRNYTIYFEMFVICTHIIAVLIQDIDLDVL